MADENPAIAPVGSESASAPITRSPVAVPGKRGRRPWSTILLREWALLRYPGVRLWEQLRLGPTEAKLVGVEVSPALENALRVENWYADGVLILPHEVLIVESKIKATPAAEGQVNFYVERAFATPFLQPYMNLPFQAVLLFGESDPVVENFCRRKGCRVEVYTPQWIADYLTQVQLRPRNPPSPIPADAAE